MARMASSRSKARSPALPTPSAGAEAPAGATPATEADGPVRVLKKYPNRRLYDTRSSSYITLADVKQMVLAAEPFEVRDAKSGDDLTRSILLQIILEEESGGVPLFSAAALAQIIRLHGHAMQGLLGSMIERNLLAFADFQQQLLQQGKGLLEPAPVPGMASTELWTQFVNGQSAAMQGLMDAYVAQGRSMFERAQKAGALFPGVPGFPPTR
jgi:polyhydroxyalkanoate synthesis repressor PhaR